MDNQNQNTSTEKTSVDSGPLFSTGYISETPELSDENSLSLEPTTLADGAIAVVPQEHTSIISRILRRVDLLLLALLVLGALGLAVNSVLHRQNTAVNNTSTQNFGTVKLPLSQFVSSDDGLKLTSGSVTINGPLKLNAGVVVTPSVQPNTPVSGQLYYDQNTNQLAYYNGTAFVPLSASEQAVRSIGGATGTLTLGGGLSVLGNQLIATNTGVTSLGGQNGEIVVGQGLNLTGNTLQNVGALSITAGANVAVVNDGSGNYTISNTGAGTGTVTSSGGTTGTLPLFTASQNIEDSIISQSGGTVTITGNLNVSSITLLGTPLSVTSGGTGASSLTANGVLVGNGTSTVSSIAAGVAGQCLLSTAGAPAWGVCPGGGGSSVTSLNGLTGALSVANATSAGSTITLDDASTSGKGIARFNSTNFTASAGLVNLVQDITTASAPSFGQLSLVSSQASNPMLFVNNTNAGASGNLLDLQVNGSSKFSVQPNGNTAVSGTINGQTISNAANFTGSLAAAGNTTVGGTLGVTGNTTLTGDIAVNGGDITASGALNITPGGALTITPGGTLTMGSGSQTLALQGGSASTFAVTNGGNTTTVNFQAPTANVTYRFPTATAGSYDICSTAGNCAGTGGGVTTAGGSTNRLAKFSGSQVIGDSTISDNGTTVTTTANLTVQGGTLTAGVASSQTGTLVLAYGSANFTGSVVTGALTANRTYTLPDASGTFCLNGSSSCGFATGSGTAFVQNGNTLGAAANLGTNDSNDLNVRTAGVTRMTITSTGDVNVVANFDADGTVTAGTGNAFQVAANGNTTTSGDVAVNGGDITASGALNITPGGTLTVGATGQTLALQGGAGTTLSATNGGNTTTVNFQAPTASVTYRFATTTAGTYDICSTAGNCAGSGGGVTTGGGTTNRLAKFSGSQAIADSSITDNGGTVTTTSNFVIQGGTGTIGVAGLAGGSLVLADGGSSFSGTVQVASLTAARTYTFPDSTGTVCLSSGNCLGGGGGGANTALSNLSSVAINTSLLPGAAGTIHLGSATLPFGDLYLAGSSGTPGSNNFRVTGTATGARTITLPDASGTVCLQSAAACGFTTGSGTAFVQNGNTLGAAANLGTNDSNALNLRTNGISRITIAANGSDATLASNMDLIMQGATAYITNAQGQTNSEAFGLNATVAGANSLAVGAGASGHASGGSTAVGSSSSAGVNGTALGYASSAQGNATALGYGATADSSGVAIGRDAIATTNAIAIGRDATSSTANQMVIGSSVTNEYIDKVIIGSGATSATPTGFTLQGTGGSGSNVAGAAVNIAGGASTGNAAGGNVNIQVATPGSSGSSANVSQTVLTLSGTNGSALFKNVVNSANALEVQTSGGSPVFTVNTSSPAASVAGAFTATGNINTSGGVLQTGSTTRLDASGNLVNIGNITGSGATNISAGGTLTVGSTSQILALQGNASSTWAVTGGGFTTGVGFSGAPTAGVTYNFDRSAAAGTYTVCTSAGNCLGGGGGANTMLSNLTGVAINTTLLPGTAGAINLGSGTLPFGDLYLAGSSSTPASNNFRITGASTGGARTITLPDASGTVCLQSAAACGFAPTSGSANYIQNGTSSQTANFFVTSSSAASVAGVVRGASSQTADIFQVQTNGGSVLFGIDGDTNYSTFNDNLNVYGQGTSSDTSLTVRSNASANSGSLIADFQAYNGSTTTSVARFTYGAGLYLGNGPAGVAGSVNIGNAGGFYGTINSSALTTDRTVTLANLSGTLCVAGQNCAVNLQDAYNLTSSEPEIKLNSTRNALDIQDADTTLGSSQNFISLRGSNSGGAGTILFGVGIQGNLYVQPSSNRTDLFDINNAAGNNVFTIDSATSNGRVGIGLGGAANPSYTLDVAGDTNISSGSVYRINGTTICSSSGCTPASGSNNYIQNQSASAQTADFQISGTGRANTSVQTPLVDTASAVALALGTTNATAINLNQNATVAAGKTLTVTSALTTLTGATTGDALSVSNSTSTGNIAVFNDNSTAVVTIGDGGATLVKNSSDSGTAFRIQNASSVNLLSISTLAGTNSAVQLYAPNAINSTTTEGLWLRAPKNTVTALFGDNDSTAAYVSNDASANLRFNGSGVGWGDFGYYPQGGGNGNNGQFRFSTTGSSISTTPNAKVGVGDLYVNGTLGISTNSPSTTLAFGTGANRTIGVETQTSSNTAGNNLTMTAATGNGTGAGGQLALQGGVSGTGSAATGGAVLIQGGTGNGSGASIGGAVTIDAGSGASAGGAIAIGTTNATGITLGTNTATAITLNSGTGTINIGNGAQNRTINIGTGAAVQTVSVGSTNGASATTISSGTGNMLLQTNSSSAQITVKSQTNGANAFQVQNASGSNLLNVDTSSSIVSVNTGIGGALTSWSTLSSTLNTGASFGGSAVANGYIYSIGGYSGAYQATVQYASLKSDGTMGTWATTTALPAARAFMMSGVAVYDNFMYVVGGSPDAVNGVSTVYYARLHSDGTVGAWNTTSTLPANRLGAAVVVNNGHIFALGGGTDSTTPSNTIYEATINSDGTLTPWATDATTLPVTYSNASAVVANGKVYYMGGTNSGGTSQTGIYYATVDPLTGDVGSFTTNGTSLPTATSSANAVLYNGYIYVMNGGVNAYYYAPVVSAGSVGTWSSQISMSPMTTRTGVTTSFFNGYFYAIGGFTGGAGQTAIYSSSAARTKINGTLDLVGSNDGIVASDGSVGGTLTVGDANVIGRLDVQSQANFGQGVSIAGNLSLGTENEDGRYNTMTIRSKAYSGISLLGDTANTGGEPGGAFIDFGVDSNTTFGTVGIAQAAALSPDGLTTVTSGLANAFLVGSTVGSGATQIISGDGSGNGVARITVVNGATTRVCIAMTTCSNSTLGVTGTIKATSTITASTTPDIAETIAAAPDVEAADVVMADPNNTERVVKSTGAYQGAALGVISDGTSSFMINSYGNDSFDTLTGKPLVLAGRVPVKVTMEGGAVKPGDYLTSSSTPGKAMKATHAGPTIGKALGFYDSEDGEDGTVLALINVSYYSPQLQGSNDGSFVNLNASGNVNIGGNLTVTGTATFGVIYVNGKIITAGGAPDITAQAAAGTGATVTVSGNDIAGRIEVTTGDTPSADTLAKLQFHSAYATGIPQVVLTAVGKGSAQAQPYVDDITSGSFTVGAGTAPQPNTKYVFTYHVIGTADD